MKNIILHEITPADQAKSLGLIYGGFGQWIDPKTRITKARTIDGKLVKVDSSSEDAPEADLGKINIFVVDHSVLEKAKRVPDSRFVEIYNKLLKAMVKIGGAENVMLVNQHSQQEVAEYFRKIGISAGVNLTPIDMNDPNKIHEFVEKKIKEGYTHIEFYDNNQVNIESVESLRAPYNKLDLTIDTHPLKKMGAA